MPTVAVPQYLLNEYNLSANCDPFSSGKPCYAGPYNDGTYNTIYSYNYHPNGTSVTQNGIPSGTVLGGNSSSSSSAIISSSGANSSTVITTHHASLFHQYFFFGIDHTTQALSIVLYCLIARYIIWPFIAAPILDWLDWRRQRHANNVLLQLIPPTTNTKTAAATTELFRKLNSLIAAQPYEDRLRRHKKTISFSDLSDRPDGIRFVASLPRGLLEPFKQNITSYLPEIQFKELPKYLNGSLLALSADHSVTVLEFKQARSFVYPLRSQEDLETYDPVSSIANMMTNLEPGEQCAVQLVLSPYRSSRANRIRRKLIQGKDPRLLTWNIRSIVMVLINVLAVTMTALVGIFTFFLDFFTGQSARADGNGHPASFAASMAGQAELDKMSAKLAEPLFYADYRICLVANDAARADTRLNGLTSSLASFTDLGYQELITSDSFWPFPLNHLLQAWHKTSWGQSYRQFRLTKFEHCLPSAITANSNVLSASEVAGLFHFPYGHASNLENLAVTRSRTLAAPAAMKRVADSGGFDVKLGVNRHLGQETPIGLTTGERECHTYIIGGTGSGKTTLLEYMIVQDIRNGKGVAVIDPHGDMAEDLLHYIPKARLNDVVYFNPDDLDYPIGLNLLELPPGLTGSNLDREKERVAEAVVSTFRKLFSDDDSGGHRIEYILRNAIHTAFTVENATLFTIFRLLTNDIFRNQVVSKLENEDLKNFWETEFGKAGSFRRSSLMGGVTAKVGRFMLSASASRILGQAHSTIDFEDIINSNKILICNFSKDLGDDTSQLFGTTILARLQIAAYRRRRLSPEKRTPYYLYVDEFQNFATPAFEQILSQARKYKLYLAIAEQGTAQQDLQTVEVLLGNVGTVICFRTGSPQDEQLMLHKFGSYVSEGMIANLPAYNFYVKVDEKEAGEPFSGETVRPKVGFGAKATVEQVIQLSRENYAGNSLPAPSSPNGTPLPNNEPDKPHDLPPPERQE